MDAFELLKKDHRKVSQLFSGIESASGQAKMKLFGQLKAELDLHAHIEETVLYPAIEDTNEAREITLEAYEEHKVVKDLLGALASAGAPDEVWDAKLTVLKENVEHHVKEEEGELFDKARKALGDERIEELGAELEAAKSRNTISKPGRTTTTKKAAATKSSGSTGTESPGVLQRLANFIGLADAPAGKTKTAAAGGKTQTTGSTAKSASKKGAAAKATKRTSSGVKSAKLSKTSTKKVASKGATKSAAKARSSRKAAPAKKASSSSRSRTSATKNAPRASSNQKVKAASPGRKTARSSAKSRNKSGK